MASTNTVTHRIDHTLGADQAKQAALAALKYYTEKFPAWAFDVTDRAEPGASDVVMHTPLHVDVKMVVRFSQGMTEIEAQVPFLATPFVRKAMAKVSEQAAVWIEQSGGRVL